MVRWTAWNAASCVCRARAGRVAGGNRVSESGDVSANAAGIEPAAGVAVGGGECRHLRIGRAGGYNAPGRRFSAFWAYPAGGRLRPLHGGLAQPGRKAAIALPPPRRTRSPPRGGTDT